MFAPRNWASQRGVDLLSTHDHGRPDWPFCLHHSAHELQAVRLVLRVVPAPDPKEFRRLLFAVFWASQLLAARIADTVSAHAA